MTTRPNLITSLRTYIPFINKSRTLQRDTDKEMMHAYLKSYDKNRYYESVSKKKKNYEWQNIIVDIFPTLIDIQLVFFFFVFLLKKS